MTAESPTALPRLGHPAAVPSPRPSVVRELRGHHGRRQTATVAPRLLIADDQRLFRLGLEQLLRSDQRVEVVGLAADGEEAVRQCELLRPDVVLINIQMPGIGGLAATRRILGLGAAVNVIILTSSALDADVAAAFHAGASGYILKDTEEEALIHSVLAVHLGAQVFTGARPGEGLGLRGVLAGGAEPDEKLTPCERSILQLVAAGGANRDIANQLGISEKTVRNHMSHIYEKLQVRGRSGVLLYAMRKGLVNA
jgi:two-component system, NarL family, response regulator LiaR